MQSSRFDDSQDVSSSKDSQDDGSQMLDTRKIEEMIEKHKTTVSSYLQHCCVAMLTAFTVGQNPSSRRRIASPQSAGRGLGHIATTKAS
jgi:hypothetical protein